MKAEKVMGDSDIINSSGVCKNNFQEYLKLGGMKMKVTGKKSAVKLVGAEVKGTKATAVATSAKKPESKVVARQLLDRNTFVGKIYLHTKKDNRKVKVLGLKKNCPKGTGLVVEYLDDNHKGTVTYKFLAPIAEGQKKLKAAKAVTTK